MDTTGLDLSKIRHELRGPINQIIGYCELLIEQETTPAGFVDDLERIREGGKGLLSVLGEYFDEAQFERRRRDLHQLHHDLRTPVNHVIGYCELLEEQAAEARLGQVGDDLRRIREAASRWLEMMEEHLLPAGVGIDDSAMYLMSTPAVALRTVAPRSAEPASLSGRGRVLVVDDDAGNRELLARRLARHGFEVSTAGDGLEALKRVRSGPFDLLLLDLIMPGLDGYQVLTKLKSDPALRHIPVLMISGLDQENGIARCIEAGADDYLTKPFNPVLLRARIGACLEKKRLRDQEQETYRALVASQRVLAAELAEAGAYVASLLPAPLAQGPVRADWSFQPSTQLGGDSFGYHWIDEDRFAVYLIDVCGHGVGAALLSVSALNVLRSGPLWGEAGTDPARVLGALNGMFPMEAQHGQYFTMWVGIWSRRERRLRYASAGHPPALLLSPGAVPAELRTPRPPVGVAPDTAYASGEADVPGEATLFVLSDGVFEVERPDGTPGTFRDFAARLASDSVRPGFKPSDCLEAARGGATAGGLDDDFSLLRVTFPAAGSEGPGGGI